MQSCVSGHIVTNVLKDRSAFEMLELLTQHSFTSQGLELLATLLWEP